MPEDASKSQGQNQGQNQGSTAPAGVGLFFELFNEIGIIEQLSRTMAQSVLPDGLMMTHFSVLNHLTRVADGRTPLEIARAFQVPKTSMTHTLKGLEAHGFVEMRPNPGDARSKQVWLTDAGRAFRAKAIADISAAFAPIAPMLDADKAEEALPILREI
ncbi:MAG: MarR family transcriptional regulator, partial [Pseudomonadota bacterium]